MKRYGNLYEKIYNMSNIRLAHINARKGKKHYAEVKLVDANPEYYFKKVYVMLKNKTFKNSKYHIFKMNENGKTREIFKLPYFPDRIIHHCIMQVVEPIWKKTLIRDTYSSIKGRGLHDGVRRIKEALKDRNGTKYCLKLDIKKFYPSVNHTVLKEIIQKKIKCVDTLQLIYEIIDSAPGIPIGNYLSQYFGNIYLSSLDHYIKEECQAKYYFRYCDDLVLLSDSKEKLHRILCLIKNYCKSLHLLLKTNYQIFPIDDRGIDFLGYRFFHDFTLLRKSISLKFKKKIHTIEQKYSQMSNDKIVGGLMSYYGWCKHGDCQQLLSKYININIRNIVQKSCTSSERKNPLRKVVKNEIKFK